MSSYGLRILAADGEFYNGRCEALIVPAFDGQLEILAHHENMVIAVDGGEMRYKPEGSAEWIPVVVGQGFVQIANNRVILLVESAERPEDIDVARAEAARARAEERLRQKKSIQEYYHSSASLARAMARLKAVGKIRI